MRLKISAHQKLAQHGQQALAKASARLDLIHPPSVIPSDMSFRQWCQAVALERVDPESGAKRPGLLVDGRPFTLSDRPAMAWVYDQLPSTQAEAFRKRLTIMKCAQVGFTVMEMLFAIYLALKFEPLRVGMFLPDMNLARAKSADRFLPIVRGIPEARKRLIAAEPYSLNHRPSEGNVLVRRMGGSLIHFLWTSGKATTESHPMDVVCFDEVQEMRIPDVEKVGERLSASQVKFTLMGSTANWPDADIHFWYQKGSQHRFHTQCPVCAAARPLDEYFPDCIKFDPEFPDRVTGLPGDYRYVCEAGHWLDDPQQGEWIADNPDAVNRRHISIHFHQMLSPTISPREMIEAYNNADDLKNFYNRKLGKPYQDPSQIPVNLAHLNKCAQQGMAAGLVWKDRARNTFMGIDQMGAFNVVMIKERMADGRQAVIHIEEIYDADPFARCDELMALYGVQTCVVETLPNYNDAHRFAGRHTGKVFLATYADLEEGPIRWGDGPRLNPSERRTDEDVRTRYTVTLDQYKCMSLSLARLVETKCLFPDPAGLEQDVKDQGVQRRVAVLKDRAFPHFQRTALVTERPNDGERKYRRKVVKVGRDPHFSYANMLCDVAYARAYGTSTFILADSFSGDETPTMAEAMNLHGLPAPIADLLEPPLPGEVCGRCVQCPLKPSEQQNYFHCGARNLEVGYRDPGCLDFQPA